ncbi:MAG: aspartyl protease family protein [Candidatus Sulfotelmatobacter sp.]
MSALFLAVIALLAATSAFRQVPSQPPPSYRFSSGGSALNIPVELVANGLVFVKAKVNENAGWFILDNGSQGFTIDRHYAEKIGLQSSGSAAARGGGANAIDAGVIRDVEIGLPGLALTHRNLVVIDLKPLEPSVGHEVDGIIGSRLFDDFVVLLDYERRMVSVFLPTQYQPAAGATVFPVHIDEHGFQFIDASVTLPGIEPVAGKFLIDGGANTYADIYKPFSDAHHLPPPAMKLLEEPGTSTGGTTQSRDGRADQITVGPFSIKSPPITFAQDTEGLMASKDYAGLIGAEFLERFTVVFDSPVRQVWLAPNHSYSEPTEYDESGLRIRAEGRDFHRFVVRRILSGSAAAEAGTESGDVIESIDKRAANEMTLTEIRTMFCKPNAKYSIGILRGSKHFQVLLSLRPLL